MDKSSLLDELLGYQDILTHSFLEMFKDKYLLKNSNFFIFSFSSSFSLNHLLIHLHIHLQYHSTLGSFSPPEPKLPPPPSPWSFFPSLFEEEREAEEEAATEKE